MIYSSEAIDYRKLTASRRNMEDFVTWVDSSKIKKNIMKYRDAMDDFDLL
jgi:hypothetical protein